MEPNEPCRPVPAPRRLYPELRKSEYENVTVDLINKNLNIKSENIHSSSNVTDKLPNNKVFLTTGVDEQTNVFTTKSILTETNDLYGPNANENVPTEVYATPTPAPRPRNKQQNNANDDDIYENTPGATSAESTLTTPTTPKTNALYPNLQHCTGAISKDSAGGRVLRRAPELPPKTLDGSVTSNIPQRHSISSEFSTTSSYNIADSNSTNGQMPRSASNATLESSLDGSAEGSDGGKYKSPSPGYVNTESETEEDSLECESSVAALSGNTPAVRDSLDLSSATTNAHATCTDSANANDLFKSLSTTSRLLTESIGERVAVKAKGAKHKLDKNLKSSGELLSNLSIETSARLKNASKRFGTNFTLGKKEKDKNKENMPTGFAADRPQTLPPNDQVFNTISFSSPLQRKADGLEDLRVNDSDCSYDMPRSTKVKNKTDLQLQSPPSYEDALSDAAASKSFTRNMTTSRSLMVPKHIAAEAANVALSKQRSNMSLNRVLEEKSGDSSDAMSRDSLDLISPPMPNFPPPKLPSPSIAASGGEATYGKLNPVQAPARQKRRKNYEQIELRRVADSSPTSLRPNVDSTELLQLSLSVDANEREESMILREHINAAEELTPKPDRSNSWEYFEESREESESSSPEPVYANQEATYGKVFEMASSSKDLLPSRSAERILREDGAGAVGGWVQPPKEIIQEFDPLLSRKGSTLSSSEKSNQLLLLEHLLEEDIYGTVRVTRVGTEVKSDDDISMCTSEEDNQASAGAASTSCSTAEPKVLTVVLPTPSGSNAYKINKTDLENRLQIVHQNAHLLSDSMENMLEDEESRAKPYLSKTVEPAANTDPVDLARSSQNRTNWFVDGTQPRANPFNKLNIEDGECPPSYLEAIGADGKPTSSGEQKSLASRFMNPKNMFSNVKIRVDALKRKTSFRAAQKASDVKVTLQMVPRPSLSPLLVRYEGQLIRFPSGVVEDILKEMQHRRAILRDRQFQTFLDMEMKTPKETIPLEYITTLQCVSNNRVTDNATHFYCFEVTTSVPKNTNSSNSTVQTMSNPNLVMTSGSSGNCKHQRVSHLYGVGKESERDIWMQKILESLTNVIPPKYVCHYYRAGWCYLKNSITSEWSGTWLVLKKSQRRLAFVTDATQNVERMDLRKARCVVIKESDETIRNLHVESGPTLMIDCPPFTVYMIMSSSRETKIWRHIIREVAHNNGFALNEQQLTKYNVPVIVDKCINFVYIHGSMSEGIYRKSGSEASIAKLMAAFRADAFNVEITRNEYNEHDVANVLKRFMRDLPERLLGKLTESFICVGELKKSAEKIPLYKELLMRLTVIERETLKKIVGHLAFISSQRPKNKMSVQNLTTIWGPTLLQSHQAEEMVYSQKEAEVLADLIMLYKNLFPLSADGLKKEQEMLLCLQKYYAAAETLTDSVKKSGDLKMWITLNPNPENTTEEKTQINVTISPTKTAYEVCKEMAAKMKMSTHQISLHEIILNGSLERPLHHDTKVFDVVLNWSYWPEDDRKHNYLEVKPIDVLKEVQRAVKNLATVTPGKELKFADNRTKSFKSYQCELRDGKIVVSKKDKNDKTTIVREIFLQSSTAYLGCEKKRDFPWSWAITFVERTQTQILRSRDLPFIGHVLAGSEWVDRTIWYSSIWYCLHGDNILPPAEIILK